MRSRQKAREPTPGMPLGEEQENSNTTETMPYGLRQSTLTARSAEPNLTRPKKKCPNSRPQGTTDNVVSRDLVKETAQRLQEEDGERDSVPMPPVSKSRNARSGDNPVTAGTIGLGNPSARADLEPVRTASGGIKRNREVASDPDDTVPSRKIMRSQSPSPDAGEETNSLRHPSQSQDAAGSQGEYSGDDSNSHGDNNSDTESDADCYASDGANVEEGLLESAGNGQAKDDSDRVLSNGLRGGDKHGAGSNSDTLNHGVVIKPKESLPEAAKTNDDTLNHGVVIKPKEGLPAAAKTKKRRSNHNSRDDDLGATEHSPADSEAALHDGHQPAPAAPKSSQGASAETRVRRGDPARRPVGYHSRGAKAKRRQERAAGSNRPSGDDTGGKKTHWTINDLPRGINLNKWNVFIVAHFIRHFACFGEPWDANAYLEIAQTLWKETFPDSTHIPTQKDDAVYPLLRQHIYDFRSGLADRAERAVEDFFAGDPLFDSAEGIRKYVNWAAPPPKVITNSNGRRLMVEDHIFPYMYKHNIEDPMTRTREKLRGVFQHECILNTLAYYIEATLHLPDMLYSAEPPRAALALATVAVERALKQWSTGQYVLDPINFCASEWGAETHDLQVAVGKLTEAKWEQILQKSMEYTGKYKPITAFKGLFASKVLNGRRSGRSRIVISDDEEDSNGFESDTRAPAA
ncbi:hypothetical protein F5887DRAFT_1071711 [Amanita rubescens]|nr:hypothetical protein F5887DRAFT_1087232 [Amanita rubescens]KAF8348054.1 hypothetical protein F5887DRAFT_1071711 [Amanita rubescens]